VTAWRESPGIMGNQTTKTCSWRCRFIEHLFLHHPGAIAAAASGRRKEQNHSDLALGLNKGLP
jgi:hypothetical protein